MDPDRLSEGRLDQATGRWISRAEVAEIPFIAFASRPKSQYQPGRLVVRRIPELNSNGQDGLFDVWRFHAFFTTSTLDTVTADKTIRGHAIIEQVHADLKNSALAHLPSGKFNANAAWLVLAVMAFNLTRAAATLTGPQLGKSNHWHHPKHPDQCPGPGRHLGPTARLAPARRLALTARLDPAIRPNLRATYGPRHLTTQPHHRRNQRHLEPTGSKAGVAATRSTRTTPPQRFKINQPAHRDPG